jgi:hypothetical protein
MVVQRTLAKIEELKERPHHERRTIAMYWAVGIVIALTVFWGFFAVRAVGRTAVNLTNLQNTPQVSVQTASAAGAFESDSTETRSNLMASSTNGYVDLVPSTQ